MEQDSSGNDQIAKPLKYSKGKRIIFSLIGWLVGTFIGANSLSSFQNQTSDSYDYFGLVAIFGGGIFGFWQTGRWYRAKIRADSSASAEKKTITPLQRLFISFVTLFVVLWIAGNLLSSTSDNTSSDANPTQTQTEQSKTPVAPTQAEVRTEVTFAGEGGLNDNTAPQDLSGSYQITWQTNGDCVYYGDLNGVDVFSTDTQAKGTNYIYDLVSDSYYMHVITGPAGDCTWSVKFTPIS